MNRSTPQRSRSRTQRRVSWLVAVVLAATLSAFGGGARAAAAPSDTIYHPHCYDTLCLVYDGQLIAWSRYDVGPTPYYISIFGADTGERLAVCASGTQCSAPAYVGYCATYIAYIGGFPSSTPPAPVLQTSAVLGRCIGVG
jgi:hypothetical protein